jgi:hypothetical protein
MPESNLRTPACPAGIEQLQPEIVCVGPSLQECEHSQAPTASHVHFREIQYNDAGGGLRQDSMTTFENSLAVYDSGFALNYCHVSHLLDIMLSLTSSHTYSLASGSKSLAKRRVALFSARCTQRRRKRKTLLGRYRENLHYQICTTKSEPKTPVSLTGML